jgi:hypothetical protein
VIVGPLDHWPSSSAELADGIWWLADYDVITMTWRGIVYRDGSLVASPAFPLLREKHQAYEWIDLLLSRWAEEEL